MAEMKRVGWVIQIWFNSGWNTKEIWDLPTTRDEAIADWNERINPYDNEFAVMGHRGLARCVKVFTEVE